MKIVINKCFGGFGLSEAAYEWLIARGIPVQKYIEQKRGDDGFFLPEPRNDGRIIFDDLNNNDSELSASVQLLGRRYWDTWISLERADPLLVECVETLGEDANGKFADLAIVTIPDDVDYEIDDYDGQESIHEKHRTWG